MLLARRWCMVRCALVLITTSILGGQLVHEGEDRARRDASSTPSCFYGVVAEFSRLEVTPGSSFEIDLTLDGQPCVSASMGSGGSGQRCSVAATGATCRAVDHLSLIPECTLSPGDVSVHFMTPDEYLFDGAVHRLGATVRDGKGKAVFRGESKIQLVPFYPEPGSRNACYTGIARF